MDETWLSIGGAKRPVAVVLGPKGQRLDLRLSGPGCDGGDWFTDLARRGRGLPMPHIFFCSFRPVRRPYGEPAGWGDKMRRHAIKNRELFA